MKIKAFLADFDGTLVSRDILDVVCGIVGKEEASRKLNYEFINGHRSGLPTLITRINFLKGVSIREIYQKLEAENHLVKGAPELFQFLNSKNIVSIVHSGNLAQILNYYQKLLNITYIVGSNPKMDGDRIDSIGTEDFHGSDFKLDGCKNILETLRIEPSEVVTIGDSLGDKALFEFAAKSIAIDPKGGIDQYADFIIENDLSEAIAVIKNLSDE